MFIMCMYLCSVLGVLGFVVVDFKSCFLKIKLFSLFLKKEPIQKISLTM
jgi:hypothetical protein